MEDKQFIPDYKVKVPKVPLKAMFSQQRKFQAKFYNIGKMTQQEWTDYIRLMLTCVQVEAVEALNWVNWKPWKKTKHEFNREEYINELVDIQHFLINCALAVDCDHEEFTQAFFNKGKENIVRQEKGY